MENRALCVIEYIESYSVSYRAKLTRRNLIRVQDTEMCVFLKVSSVVHLELQA